MEVKDHIDKLRFILNQHNIDYYVNDNPTISDYEYDTLLRQLEKLEKEVQDPNHLIQENVDKDWIHGGIPTREIMRNIDYLKRCNNEK